MSREGLFGWGVEIVLVDIICQGLIISFFCIFFFVLFFFIIILIEAFSDSVFFPQVVGQLYMSCRS